MSPITKIVIIIVALAGVLAVVPVGPQDEPLLSATRLLRLMRGGEFSTPDPGTPKPYAGKDKIYKWRDAKGQLHLSSEPPPKDQKVEVMEVDPEAVTTLPSVSVEEN